MVLVVCTSGDLDQLPRSKSWRNPFDQPRLLIRSPLLSRSEIAQWQAKFDGLRQACGCSHGAIALCGFLVLFIAYSIGTDSPANTPADRGTIFFRAAVLVAGLIVSVVAGKLFGLYRARAQFHQACRNLKSRLASLNPDLYPGFDRHPPR
jgi:hypothetical protein